MPLTISDSSETFIQMEVIIPKHFWVHSAGDLFSGTPTTSWITLQNTRQRIRNRLLQTEQERFQIWQMALGNRNETAMRTHYFNIDTQRWSHIRT